MNAPNDVQSRYSSSALTKDAKLIVNLVAIAISIIAIAFYEIILKNIGKAFLIAGVEVLYPFFSIRRAYRKWRTEKTLAKESLLVGLLGGVCLIGIITFWPAHRPFILNSMMSIAFVAMYIQCLLWNDHLRDKV